MELNKLISIESKGKVELCSECDGSGRVFDNSFGSGASDEIQCNVCDGSGRIRKVYAMCKVAIPFNYEDK